jgi:hypothetical protein
MVKKQDLKRIIQEALANQDPAKLKDVFIRNMTMNDMDILRKRISDIVIEPRFYKTVFAWLSHDDPEIARATWILALWIDDRSFLVELFDYLTRIETSKIPFTVDYNSAEKEFSIEMPGVPGWGISYYGRGNRDVDLLLHALEKFYAHIHPEKHHYS